eukprot:1138103-Pelagomonas_calceolata.AAC.6
MELRGLRTQLFGHALPVLHIWNRAAWHTDRRKNSPPGQERALWYSSTFGDWDLSKGGAVQCAQAPGGRQLIARCSCWGMNERMKKREK